MTEHEIIFNNFDRIVYADKHKIPLFTSIYKKQEDKVSLGNNFIESNEYWDSLQTNKVFDLYKLVNTLPLPKIVDEYVVDTTDVIMVYYDVFGDTLDLRNYVENTLTQYYSKESMEQRHKNWKLTTIDNIKYTGVVKRNMEKLQKWLNNASKSIEFKTSPIEIISASLEGDIQLKIADQQNEIAFIPVNESIGLDVFLQSFVSLQIPFISYKGSPDSEVKIKVFEGELPMSLDKIKPSDSQVEAPHTLYCTVWNDKVNTSKANMESYVNVKFDLIHKKASFSSKMTEANTENGKPLLLKRIVKNMPLRIINLKEMNLMGEFNIYGLDLNNHLFLDFIMNNPLATQLIYMNETSTSLAMKKRINYHLRETDLDFNNAVNVWRKYYTVLLHQEHANKAEDKPIVDYFNDANTTNTNNVNATTNTKTNAKQNKNNTKKDATQKKNNVNKAISLTKNMPYLHVSISHSENRHTLQLGLLIFISMIGIFKHREHNLEEIYQKLKIKFHSKPIKVNIVDTKRTNVEGDEYISDLQNAAPHIFENNYKSLICQKVIQPIIIPPTLQNEWDEQHTDPYQKAIAFPPNASPNDQILLGCPAEKTPYVSMKENTLVNQDEFPYLPCCTSKNTQLPNSHSLFTHYYLGEDLTNEKKVSVDEINSRKRLVKGQIGSLPFIIQSTFSLMNIVTQGNVDGAAKVDVGNVDDLRRFGVGHSPLSAVRCLLWATNNETFNKLNQKKESLENELAIEAYIRQLINKSMSQKNKGNRVWETAMSQELFGYDNDEIKTALTSVEYFDTKLFYRWLEIYFNVHVFVFCITKEQEVEFEIPQHKLFHARCHLNLPCIILFKHWGSENDAIDFPQYEIIYSQQPNIKPNTKQDKSGNQQDREQKSNTKQDNIQQNMLWDRNVSKKLIEFSHQIQTVYQFDKKSNQLRQNPYSLDYLLDVFPNALTQYIDGAGKMRGITIGLNNENKEERITIYTVPSQPVNLDIEYSEYSVDPNTAIHLFTEKPTFYSLEENKVNGIWFPMYDIAMGVYVPIIETEKSDFERILRENKIKPIPEGRENPYYVYGESILDTYHNVEKMRNVYLQAILWAFLIYTKQKYVKESVPTFMKQFVQVKKFNYKKGLEGINTSLPEYKRIDVAMNYLETLFPFVENSMFLCVNVEMLNKIEYFLNVTVDRHNQQESLMLEKIRLNPEYNTNDAVTSLYTLYSSSDDFPRTHNMQVFFNLNNFKSWMYNKLYGKGDKIEIIQKMSLSNSTFKNPFLYMQQTTNQIFLIQNVSLGDEKRAINNYLKYIQEGINMGYFTPPVVNIVNNEKIIYVVSPSGDLQIESGKNENDSKQIHLLRYMPNVFAAIYKLT